MRETPIPSLKDSNNDLKSRVVVTEAIGIVVTETVVTGAMTVGIETAVIEAMTVAEIVIVATVVIAAAMVVVLVGIAETVVIVVVIMAADATMTIVVETTIIAINSITVHFHLKSGTQGPLLRALTRSFL